MSELIDQSDPIIRSSQRAHRPSIALIRGEALNPFEMQVYAPLTTRFDLLGVGRRRPSYEVEQLPMPVRLLPSVGSYPMAQAAYRRVPAWMRYPNDPNRLFGFAKAVAGREVLHAAETALAVSEQAAESVASSGAKLVLTCWE